MVQNVLYVNIYIVDIGQVIERLEIRKERLLGFLPEKRRLYFEELEKRFNDRGILLTGARGAGKTTFLLLMAKKRGYFYIPADDPLILDVSFYDLMEKVLTDYKGVILDEVHFLKGWSKFVKTFYDAYPNKTFWLSDSSSIVLQKSLEDLSRRFVIINLPLMSFREFVYFETNDVLPKIEDPFDKHQLEIAKDIAKRIDVLSHFRKYKEQGTRPIYLEGSFKEKMKNIVEKTLYYDIPYFLKEVNENYIGVMRAILSHIAYSKIPTINIEAMCRNWGIGKSKVYELLNVMEKVNLINIVEKEKSTKTYTKGSKIFFQDPSLYYVYEGEIGNYREAFVVFSLKEKGNLYAQKDDSKGDFIFNGISIEVGGSHKSPKNSDFVIRDDVDFPIKNIIPMWTLGMLW